MFIFSKLLGIITLLFYLEGCHANISIKDEIKFRKGPTNTQGKIPNGGFLQELSARDKLDCARTCTDNASCASMYYLEDTQSCKLHAQKIGDITAGLDVYPAAVYYEVDRIYPTTTTTTTPSTTTTTTTTTTPSTTTPAPLLETAPCPVDDSMFRSAQTTDGTVFQFRVFMDHIRTYSQADAFCRSYGATLYKILTPEKMSFTLQLMSCSVYNTRDFWVDGRTTDGTWFTTDGEAVPMTSVYWASGRPNNTPPRCLWISDMFSYYLDDKWCDDVNDYPAFTLCQI